MRICVANEERFHATPDGAVSIQTPHAHSYWTRYLDVFDHVRVVARVRKVPSVPSDWKRTDGEGISIAAVPDYLGPWRYVLQAKQVQRAARNAIGSSDAVILHAGTQIAACIEPLLHRTDHPYGVYVIADPYDVFAPGACTHPLRPFFRWRVPTL